MRTLAAAPRRIAVDLTPEAVEALATRIMELRAEEREPDLLTAGELALHLRVQRSWVYKNRELLGGEPINTGPKAPWRFELETAKEALRAHRAGADGPGGA
jgi:hypothetical protein